ncbi:MAG: MBL fold metallo-hydrolase [Bacteroidetes bacterium]|nr:MBL fold metallo-hydrolase [Bacteroidota bacterium]
MNLKFCGAARQVTGSMYLLEVDDYRILIDCGLNYEPGFQRELNARFPFEPSEIDVVILTHAHLDHSGNIPTLYKKGFKGSVLCTEPTLALCEILLTDSATIEGARVQSGHKSKKKISGLHRLYGHGDVRDALNQFVTLPFHQPFELNSAIKLEFIPAGHILGAASVQLDIREKGKTKRLLFTGDLGNRESVITVDPEAPQNVDFLVMEGTYGSRFHQDTSEGEEVLRKYVEQVCQKQRGRLIIPAFSVGRTQSILYSLNKLFKSGKLEKVMVFADSPMGITSSEIHTRYQSYLNQGTSEFLNEYHDLFRFKELYLIEDSDDVAFMEHYREPYIIVSSAGMLEGGRIQRHIKFNIVNPATTILMAGFCTPGTLGDKLLSGARQVIIKGKDYPVYATIARTDAFSAHPDQNGLKSYYEEVCSTGKPKSVFLSHGDPESLEKLKEVLCSAVLTEINIPEPLDEFQL